MAAPVPDHTRIARTLAGLTELSASGRPPTQAELAAAVGLARSTVALDLQRLTKAGRVVRLGGARGYVPAPKGESVE